MEPVATLTYADAMASGKQFDVLWVPAGAVDVSTIPKEEITFIAQQAPKAKYVMSVCGGAVQLAFAGVLAGKRATTNKAFYRQIVEATPKDIQWVPKARWVVDGNVWTSSGVAAGSDMALAFVEHLAGREVARFIRGGIEIPEVTEQDDPFATFHGLV
ncbi:class I glutamine amidotransferase-like protein [Mycena belliarum]|uniref:Class I glutamine amidotransferase-like protein n=1 Tax=Mycena belliarum TaxID=1033014 RepID=A0AAD6TST4_9AGAR|nr:class I glutamine amidotransferase-like protein [Mycena belliae]KAJ7076488.1 class I glutamine amidotransferase-like protein [Mycena belliae]